MDEQGVSPQPPHVGAKPQSGRRRSSLRQAVAPLAATVLGAGAGIGIGVMHPGRADAIASCTYHYHAKTTALSWIYAGAVLQTQAEARMDYKFTTDGGNGTCHEEINGVEKIVNKCYWNYTIHDTLCMSSTGHSPPADYKNAAPTYADIDSYFQSEEVSQLVSVHDNYDLKGRITMYKSGAADVACWAVDAGSLVDEVHINCGPGGL